MTDDKQQTAAARHDHPDLDPGTPTLAEPPPFVEHLACGDQPVLLLCDHAGRLVPDGVEPFGVSPANLARHIGWDIGAAAVTRRLAARLGATALLNHVSRLVIDVNRRPRSPTSIPAVSDGCVIPGNRGLSEAEIDRRIRDYFLPYHRAVARAIARFRKHRQIPVIIAVHSFTPRLNGEDRPWQVGVLWRGDRRLAGPALDRLHREPGLVVGDNQPYSGQREFGFTVTFHAQRTRLPHVMFEIRQDEIAGPVGIERHARLLGDCLEGPLADPALHAIFDGDNLPATGGLRAWRHAGHISPLG